MDEFRLIDMIKQNYYQQSTLIKGIGDDGAVFAQANKDIVTAVDTFVENIHFTKETMSTFHMGYRSIAASVSDLVAMGALPAFYLVSIIIPKQWKTIDIEAVFQGMNTFAKKYHMDLIGGDTVSGKEFTISVTVIGYVSNDRIRYRNHAKDEDIVFATGTLGDSQAGLHTLKNNLTVQNQKYFIQRHRLPEPRVAFIKALSNIKRLCLNDISDGIVNELYEIAEASKVNISIKDHLMPTHKDLAQFSDELMTQWIYFGGEDFELVGTVAKEDWPKVQQIGRATNTKVTKIGSVNNQLAKTTGHVFLMVNDRLKLLKKEGYIHLK